MGLSDWLAARAVHASQVLVVECPGAWASRVAAERAVAQRGWRLAHSPATADVLVVVGQPAEELAEVVDRLWDAMPGPRTRVDLGAGGDIRGALEGAATHLSDPRAQAEDAASRTEPDPSAQDEHAEHEGMDHGDMDMDMAPDGIPLAEGSEDDRDGLEMDALPVRLGPVLPHWPAGLVLDVMLHGDLVVSATAHLLGAGDAEDSRADGAPEARASDDVAAVLALAGWSDGAERARTARDAFLDGRDDSAGVALDDLRRRVAASRLLRWSLRGVGVLPADRAYELGLPDHLVGDCLDRLHGLLDRAEAGTAASVPASAVGPLIVGCDLGVARLVVASLGAPVATAEVRAGA